MTGASAAAARAGAVLGGYRLLEQIGTDSLGELYRTQNVRTPGLERAVRVIRAELLTQPGFRPQLGQIIELLTKVSHPNLLRIYNLGEDQQRPYIVQEMLKGQTLRALTASQKGLQPIALVADWIYQALSGLALAHQRGIVHQDLYASSKAPAESFQ